MIEFIDKYVDNSQRDSNQIKDFEKAPKINLKYSKHVYEDATI